MKRRPAEVKQTSPVLRRIQPSAFSLSLNFPAAYDVHHMRQSLLRGLPREVEGLLRGQSICMAYGKQSEMLAESGGGLIQKKRLH